MNPFRTWSQTDAALHNARVAGLRHLEVGDGIAREAKLHEQILAECKRRGWMYFHGSMAHRALRTLGEPDFTILADRGRVFFVECKSKTGKLSPEQTALKAWAEKLGHSIRTVRSIEEFLKLVDGKAGVDV